MEKWTIAFIIITLLIMTIVAYFISQNEGFDTYNLHYKRAKKYGIIDNDYELQYFWNKRNKNGINKLTQIYETIPQELPEPIPYEMPVRDDIVFTLPGRTLVWAGKKY